MVAGLQHAVQCLELPCYRRVLLWLQACSNAVQSFPTAAAGAWVCSRCRTAECRCSRDRPRPSRRRRTPRRRRRLHRRCSRLRGRCDRASCSARGSALPSVVAAHPEKRSGQRNRRRSAAAWCRLPRWYSFAGGATLVDAMLAHDGSAGPPGDGSVAVNQNLPTGPSGDNKSTFSALVFERMIRKLRRQDIPP